MDRAILDRINSVSITKNDLWELAGDAQEFNGEHCFEADMFLIARRAHGDFHKASAIMFRMQAIVRLLQEEGLPGWTLKQKPDGSYLVNEAVFAAAAVHPLIEKDNDLVFERETFLKKALELVEPEGEA